MFEVNELYRHKSNKKNESVVRVLDKQPDANNRVRVQFIERGRPVEYFDINTPIRDNQSIERVGVKSIREPILELVAARWEQEAAAPRIDYIDATGREHTAREYSFAMDAAEALENMEGIISYTCHSCSNNVCVEICDATFETTERECECCGCHITVSAKVSCTSCGVEREIELYDC